MKWKLLSNIFGAIFLVAILIFSAYMLVPFVKYLSVPLTGSAAAPTFSESPEVAKSKALNKKNYFNTNVFGNSSTVVDSINQVPEEGGWFNTAPLDLHALAGEDRLILVYFWSSSCSACYRTSNYMNTLWQYYRDHGLVVVGVHSPEFEFEKKPGVILKAIAAQHIAFPVLTDGNKMVWNKFGNHFSPASYLINPHGDVVYRQFSEGGYAQEEQVIRQQLTQYGWDLPPFIAVKNLLKQNDKITQTPTLYAGAGFIRRELGNDQQPALGKVTAYNLPKDLLNDRLYLAGSWKAAKDYLEALTPAQVVVNYQANTVYVVLAAATNKPMMVEVQLDDAPIPAEFRGKDIVVQQDHTYMQVKEARLYFPLNEQMPYGRHRLSLVSPMGLRLYEMTFGVYDASSATPAN